MAIKLKNFKMVTKALKVKPKRKVVDENLESFIDPTWISTGNLGTFEFDDEVTIQLEYEDPSNIVDSFQIISGSLPQGLVLNTLSGSISGYVESEETNFYEFTIRMNTIHNTSVSENFSINIEVYNVEFLWNNEGDLGEYGAGESINTDIEAEAVESS